MGFQSPNTFLLLNVFKVRNKLSYTGSELLNAIRLQIFLLKNMTTNISGRPRIAKVKAGRKIKLQAIALNQTHINLNMYKKRILSSKNRSIAVDVVWYAPGTVNKCHIFCDKMHTSKKNSNNIIKSLTETGAKFLVGNHIFNWCNARPYRKLDSNTAFRWELIELRSAEQENENGNSSADWKIKRIRLGAGKKGFENSSYYASGEFTRNCFYKIYFYSLLSEKY